MLAKLILNIAPQLEEEVVDALLALPVVVGFTCQQVYGSGKHSHMSLAEQVSGRRRRLQFELVLQESDVDAVLRQLRTQTGADSVFWVEPVSRFGKLRDLAL
jgi:nitrogen regulatory protein PII